MTLARKGTRSITVDTLDYRWLIRPGKHHDLSLIVELDQGLGQRLWAKLNEETVVKPWLVRAVIEYARAKGWQPQSPGKDCVLRVYGSLKAPEDWDSTVKIKGTEPIALSEWNPTPARLIRWAYDETLYLDGSEEALVLHKPEYLPVLIPLADDRQCPKADYILLTLAHYLRHYLLRCEGGKGKELLHEAIALGECCTSSTVKDWMTLLKQQWAYCQGIGAVTNPDQAYAMAAALLNGIDRNCPITLVAETEHSFEFGFLSSSCPLSRERLIIDKATGKFIYSQSA